MADKSVFDDTRETMRQAGEMIDGYRADSLPAALAEAEGKEQGDGKA